MNPQEMLAHLAEHGTPPGGDADVIRVSAGLQQTLGRVARETLPFVAAGGSDLQFVFGPNGRGKTHYLKSPRAVGAGTRIRHRLRRRPGQPEPVQGTGPDLPCDREPDEAAGSCRVDRKCRRSLECRGSRRS